MGGIVNAIDEKVQDVLGLESKPDYIPDREQYKRPHADEMRVRYLAIIDDYLKRHGITALIPPERLPYELRTPEQREEWRREAKNPDREEDENFKPPPPAFYDEEDKRAKPDELEAPELKEEEERPEALRQFSEKDYPNAALAATLNARRQGVTQDRPLFTTPREFFEGDQQRKQEELNRLHSYIYGARTLGRK